MCHWPVTSFLKMEKINISPLCDDLFFLFFLYFRVDSDALLCGESEFDVRMSRFDSDQKIWADQCVKFRFLTHYVPTNETWPENFSSWNPSHFDSPIDLWNQIWVPTLHWRDLDTRLKQEKWGKSIFCNFFLTLKFLDEISPSFLSLNITQPCGQLRSTIGLSVGENERRQNDNLSREKAVVVVKDWTGFLPWTGYLR